MRRTAALAGTRGGLHGRVGTMTKRRNPMTRSMMSLALALALVGCSKSEPEPAKPAAPARPAATAPAAPAAPTPSPRRPAVTIPTVAIPPTTGQSRYPETPCERHEPGWKWTGTIVENGQCIVGPCACVKE